MGLMVSTRARRRHTRGDIHGPWAAPRQGSHRPRSRVPQREGHKSNVGIVVDTRRVIASLIA